MNLNKVPGTGGKIRNDMKKVKVELVPCRECGKIIVWTGLYGDWCSTCKPRR